mgnify:CR=1 FL=1
MTTGHNLRVFWRVVKWSISLLLVVVCSIILWRVFSSGDPKEVKYLMGNDALYEAYGEHGKKMVLQYQNQDTTSKVLQRTAQGHTDSQTHRCEYSQN